MGWIPNSKGGTGDKAGIDQQSANTVPAAVRKVQRAPVMHTATAQTAAHWICAQCGVIESVREIDAKGQGSGLGVVGGGVLGGLLGNQIGAGRGKDAMTVFGLVGGAVAGNEVEKRVRTTKSYEVTMRLDDGSSRVISEANAPVWRTGDKVRLLNGAIRSNA